MHQLGPDLVYDKSLREAAEDRSNAAGEVVFSPMLFKAADLNQELSQCKIPLSSLLGLGEIATKVKARFAEARVPVEEQTLSERVRGVVPEALGRLQLTRKYDRSIDLRKRLTTATDDYEMREAVGRKTIKKHKLSAAEIETIINACKTGRQTHKEVALEFGVSPRLVSSLVVSAKKEVAFVDQTRKRETKKREKLRAVIEKSCELLTSKDGCTRAVEIKDQVEQETDFTVS